MPAFVVVAKTFVCFHSALVFAGLVAFFAAHSLSLPFVVVVAVCKQEVFDVIRGQVVVGLPCLVVVALPADQEAALGGVTFALYLEDFIQIVGVLVAAAAYMYFDAVFVLEFIAAAHMWAFEDRFFSRFVRGDLRRSSLIAHMHTFCF